MASMAIRNIVNIVHTSRLKSSPSAFVKPKPSPLITTTNIVQFLILPESSSQRKLGAAASKASVSPVDDDGVSLGTMKLPSDIDIVRFETLLFQVDKIPGGARLGFITVGDGETEVLVYIDCLVSPGSEGSAPIFRAIRNGAKRDQPPPGEPRIMRSLLEALKKCVQIARL